MENEGKNVREVRLKVEVIKERKGKGEEETGRRGRDGKGGETGGILSPLV